MKTTIDRGISMDFPLPRLISKGYSWACLIIRKAVANRRQSASEFVKQFTQSMRDSYGMQHSSCVDGDNGYTNERNDPL